MTIRSTFRVSIFEHLTYQKDLANLATNSTDPPTGICTVLRRILPSSPPIATFIVTMALLELVLVGQGKPSLYEADAATIGAFALSRVSRRRE